MNAGRLPGLLDFDTATAFLLEKLEAVHLGADRRGELLGLAVCSFL